MLVCMGELVTTEEIDELISMLDSDGEAGLAGGVLPHGHGCRSRRARFLRREAQAGSCAASARRGARGQCRRSRAAMKMKQEKKRLLKQFAEENRVKSSYVSESLERWHDLRARPRRRATTR